MFYIVELEMFSSPNLHRVDLVGTLVFRGGGRLVAEEQWQLELPALKSLLTCACAGVPSLVLCPMVPHLQRFIRPASLFTGLHRTSPSSEEMWQRPCVAMATLNYAAWT